MDLVAILEDTLRCLQDKQYVYDGKVVPITISEEVYMASTVYLPEDIQALEVPLSNIGSERAIAFDTVNADSFADARDFPNWQSKNDSTDDRVLVLNFANAFNPGGGVRFGAVAQEEELCRVSSLLLALESSNVASYYQFHAEHATDLGSDAVILTPNVVLIKDEHKNYLDQPELTSVITCAAPNLITGAADNIKLDEYLELFASRIYSVLLVAASQGYRNLVLGAFGCGAFGNNPEIVAALFETVLQEAVFGEAKANQLFDNIHFAVLDNSRDKKNFHSFACKFKTKPN